MSGLAGFKRSERRELGVASGAAGVAVGAGAVVLLGSAALAPVLAFIGVLLVAVITAVFAEGRQVRQLAHDRQLAASRLAHDRVLADRDELRKALVAGALALQDAGYVARAAQAAIFAHGEFIRDGDPELFTSMVSAGRSLAEAQIRIVLQLGEEAPAARAIQSANREHFASIFRDVRRLTPGGNADLQEVREATERHVSALAYLQRMLHIESSKLIGATTAVVAPAGPPDGQTPTVERPG